MGMFSTSRKTAVETAVLRVVDDANEPETVKQSVIEAVMERENISDTLLDNLLNSGSMNINAMYRYAETDYHYGLPQATVVNNQAGFPLVKNIIEAEIGKPITVLYMEFLPLSNTHIGWQTLTESYGYDHATNEIKSLSTTNGVPTYLDDMVSIHTQALVDEAEDGALIDLGPVGRSGYTPERPSNSAVSMQRVSMPNAYEIGTEEGVEIAAIHRVANRSLVRETIFVSLAGYDLEPEYYQCGYSYQDNAGNTVHGYWTYAFNTGTYPDLDAAFDSGEPVIGTYFPFVFFRNHKQNLAADSKQDTNAYITSKRLLDHLNMDFAEIGAEINGNPDIADVEQAYMMMGISANSTNQLDLHYLYEYFTRLGSHGIVRDPDATRSSYVSGVTNPNALLISDTHSAMRFSYYGIDSRQVSGVIGKPGEYATRTGSMTVTQTVRVRGKEGYEAYVPRDFEVPQRIYQKQLNSSTYEELTVTNPKMMYDIYKRYSHTAVVGEEPLLIPLDKTITDDFSLIEREKIYARSLHFVFNSRVTQKVKWYEGSLFKFVLVVVAVVITVLSFGSAWETIVVALGTGVWAVAKLLATFVMKTLVYSAAFELTVKELGLEDSFLVAVLAIVAAMYLGSRNGSIKDAPWASELLTTSNGLLSAIDAESARLMKELQSDRRDFELLKEEANAELEEAQALLDVDSALDPLSFVGLQPQTILGEQPNDYYQRTIHQGNIGTLGFDAITSYVDYSLTLPELKSTIGDTDNGLR